MDVKDVGKRRFKDALSPIPLAKAVKSAPSAAGKPIEGRSTAVSANELKADVQVRIASMPGAVAADFRKNLNEAISSINIASDATNSIASYLNSIDGFIEQAQSSDTSPQRKRALESEANQMVSEIKRTAREVSEVANAPIPDDKVRKEIEEKLGATLDVLIPEERGASPGLGPVSFSRKDSIIETITNVARARERLEDMRQSIKGTGDTLRMAVLSYEVAQLNGEAAQATVRDVDAAASLARTMQTSIASDPASALNAVGEVDTKALRLVE